MNLIDVYIHEVTRRVPEKLREDIALELRSTIEDMLPDNHNEDDIKIILEKLGNPATLASGYSDQPMHLIGPRYFDVYITLLKMIIPIAAVIAFISTIAEFFIGYNGESVLNVALDIMGFGIWKIIEVMMNVFFWLTIIFAILERMDHVKDGQPLTPSLKKWTPDDLKNIPYIPKKRAISKLEVFGCFLWTAIWATLYFYADHLVGIYEGGGDRLDLIMPALNQEVLLAFWPFVIAVIAFDIIVALYKLLKGQWTKKLAIINAIHEVFATVVFIVILLTPNLFNQDFINYSTNLFNSNRIEDWFIGSIIVTFIIFSVIAIIDGFRKSRN